MLRGSGDQTDLVPGLRGRGRVELLQDPQQVAEGRDVGGHAHPSVECSVVRAATGPFRDTIRRALPARPGA